jgi:hypothetical protein
VSDPRPQRGDIWRHYKGGFYVVLCVAVDANNRNEERNPGGNDRYVVVYRRIGAYQIYARAEAEFLGDAEVGGPRFTLDYRRDGAGDPAAP